MKIILFGTGPFAVPTFRSLIASDHQVVALVTRPILDSGKRRRESENPVRDLCESFGLPIYDPTSVNHPPFIEILNDLNADLFVVCDFGQILSRSCLGAARKGGINLHGSLLPKYRGAAPIHWAIYHGETETGITIFQLTPKMDGGPILTSASMPIGDDETTADIEPKLSLLSVEPVHRAIQMLESWDGKTPIGTPQDIRFATKVPRLKKSDGDIDWSRAAGQIVNQIRAFKPWPGSYTTWLDPKSGQSQRLIVHRANPINEMEAFEVINGDQREILNATIHGEIVVVDKKRLWVKTGNGLLAIVEVQPSGKRQMGVEDFLRGQLLGVGTRFQRASGPT